MSFRKAPLARALDEVAKQTAVSIIYKEDLIRDARPVTVELKDAVLEDALRECLKGQPFVYKIINNTVLVSEKKEKPVIADTTRLSADLMNVRGQVINADGQPLQGATLLLGDRAIALTDEFGIFELHARPGDSLRVTMVGMTPQSIRIGSASVLKITMLAAVARMDQVVVVGYGKQKKISVTGAVSTVQVDDLKTPSRSLANMFAGKVAGVISQQQRGEPGYDEASFTIRGISTFTGSTSPLVLVDGVERDDMQGFYSNIDPEDIQSISFLKDASATAVYGARGANGVVIITTRRGVAGKPKVALKLETGTSGLTRMPSFIDGATWMKLYNEASASQQFSDDRIEKVRSHVDPYLYPDINWMKAIYKDWSPAGANANVNVSGGGDMIRYYVSGSYFSQSGNYRINTSNPYNSNVGFKRYDFRSNIDMNLSRTTLVSLNISAMLTNGNYPGVSATTIWDDAYQQSPILFPIQYPDGKWAAPFSNQGVNPVNLVENSGYSREFKPTMQSVLSIDQRLSVITPGLSAGGKFSFDSYSETDLRRTRSGDTWLANGRDASGNLIYIQTNYGTQFLDFSSSTVDVQRTMYVEGNINYDRTFGHDHHITGLFLYNMRERTNGSATDAIGGIPYRNQGLAARATYGYKDKYLLEWDGGYTGSENFEAGHRFGFFPSVSGGWVISREDFFDPLARTFTLLKLRGSIGKVGNDQIGGGGRFPYVTSYANGSGVDFGPTQTWYQGIVQNKIGVQGLSWEISTKRNLGIDIGILNKLDLTLDGFSEKRKNILISRSSLSGILGATAPVYANLGVMDNKGFDASVSYNEKIGALRINVYGNFTYTSNKIVFADEPKPVYPWQSYTGTQYGQQWGLVADGLFTDQADIDKSPKSSYSQVRPGDIRYKDLNGDGVINDYDKRPIGGTSIPQVMYGAGVRLEYHGIHLEAFFQGAAKVDFLLMNGSTAALTSYGRGIIPFMGGVTSGNLLTAVMNRWTVDNPNPGAEWPRLSIASPGDNNYQPSTQWLRSGSYVRLKDAQVGYALSSSLMRKWGLQSMYFYLSGMNLLTFSKFKLWDPELGGGNGSGYPPLRAINLGVKTNF